MPLIVIGIGTGLFFSPNNALLLAHAPPERAGMVSGLFGTLRQAGYALGFALIASLFTVIQTSFELNWAYASLDRLPGRIASQMSDVFDGGGIWSPELLIFILRVAVLVCTAILGDEPAQFAAAAADELAPAVRGRRGAGRPPRCRGPMRSQSSCPADWP